MQLRPYQTAGIDWLTSRPSGILADEPGLGKTAQALIAARRHTSGRVLVITAPRPSYGVWLSEAERWLRERPVLYHGPHRGDAWKQLDASCGILITNYHMVREVVERLPKWPVVLIDEAHTLRNRNGPWFKGGKDKKTQERILGVKQIKAEHIIPMTGTPIVNGPEDLWPLLHLVDRQQFRGFWNWIHEHFRTLPNFYTKSEDILGLRDSAAFRASLAPYLLRRYKKDHLDELPEKLRQVVPVELTSEQRRIYDELATEMMADVGGELVLTPTKMTQLTRLRQVLVTPALIGGPEESGALTALGELVAAEIEQGRPVAVFTMFAAALPYIRKAIEKHVQHITVVRGGQTEDPFELVQAFQHHPSSKKALLASVQSSASWTATAAQTAFFLGPHYTPALNTQAEDRLHRQGQRDSVRCVYLTAAGTVDEHVADILDRKTSWQALCLDPHLLIHGRAGERRLAPYIAREAEEFVL